MLRNKILGASWHYRHPEKGLGQTVGPIKTVCMSRGKIIRFSPDWGKKRKEEGSRTCVK